MKKSRILAPILLVIFSFISCNEINHDHSQKLKEELPNIVFILKT